MGAVTGRPVSQRCCLCGEPVTFEGCLRLVGGDGVLRVHRDCAYAAVAMVRPWLQQAAAVAAQERKRAVSRLFAVG